MNKSILRLAIPNIVTNISVPLLGMVDMFLVGHLDSENYIGAIALSVMLFNFIYWSFSFLRMGTSGFVAQAYGAGNEKEQTHILLRSFAVAICIGALIIVLQYFIALVGFYFLNAEPDVKVFALEYFYIYVWAAPAVLGMYTFNGWYIGMQNATIPMIVMIIVNCVNILLSFLFVYGAGMKIEGIALASLCAQYTGFFLFVIVWNVKYGKLKRHIDLKVLKDKISYIPFFKVNRDIFIRTLALVMVTTFFMSASAKEGKDILAVNALLMQLFILFSYMMDGFAYAAEALTGRFIGEGNQLRLKELIRRLFLWGIIISGLFTCTYLFFMDSILAILTDKRNIIELSKQFQFWVVWIPFAGFSAFLWDGIFVGATASRQMRNSMLIAATCFFLLYFSFSGSSSNSVLWIAFLVYLLMRGIMQTFLAPSVLKKYN